MSSDSTVSFAICKRASATLKINSIPSLRKMSMMRQQMRLRLRAVVKSVKNQLEAYIDVWNPCKCIEYCWIRFQLSQRIIHIRRNSAKLKCDRELTCDWKWTWSSGNCSWTRFSSWYMHTPSSALELNQIIVFYKNGVWFAYKWSVGTYIDGLNMSRILCCCIIWTRTAKHSSSGICISNRPTINPLPWQ